MMNYEIYRLVRDSVEEILQERDLSKSSASEDYLTVEQVAKELNIKVSRVRTAIFSKEIPFVKIGNLVRVPRKQSHLYLEANLKLPNATGRC